MFAQKILIYFVILMPPLLYIASTPVNPSIIIIIVAVIYSASADAAPFYLKY